MLIVGCSILHVLLPVVLTIAPQLKTFPTVKVFNSFSLLANISTHPLILFCIAACHPIPHLHTSTLVPLRTISAILPLYLLLPRTSRSLWKTGVLPCILGTASCQRMKPS